MTPKINFADCYVLTPKRTAAFIQSFLDAFLPQRVPNATTYAIPQFSDDPEVTFTTLGQLLEYLEKNKNEPHAVYWSNTREEKLRGAMCIFTTDGQVIVGVYCETQFPDTAIEQDYLNALKAFCNSDMGLIEYETPAAEDTADFLQRLHAFQQKQTTGK